MLQLAKYYSINTNNIKQCNSIQLRIKKLVRMHPIINNNIRTWKWVGNKYFGHSFDWDISWLSLMTSVCIADEQNLWWVTYWIKLNVHHFYIYCSYLIKIFNLLYVFYLHTLYRDHNNAHYCHSISMFSPLYGLFTKYYLHDYYGIKDIEYKINIILLFLFEKITLSTYLYTVQKYCYRL